MNERSVTSVTTGTDSYPRIKSSSRGVLVGDKTVGKTSLLIAFARGQYPGFPTRYIPYTFESYADYHRVDGTIVLLELWDLASGDATLERMAPLAYERADVFVLFFSVVDPDSYESIRTKWAPELAHFEPNTPMLVVGLKSDLRDDSTTLDKLHDRKQAPIQHDQGVAMSKDIGANGYLECSSLKSIGVDTVFEHAMRLALQYPKHERNGRKPHRKECIIL